MSTNSGYCRFPYIKLSFVRKHLLRLVVLGGHEGHLRDNSGAVQAGLGVQGPGNKEVITAQLRANLGVYDVGGGSSQGCATSKVSFLANMV